MRRMLHLGKNRRYLVSRIAFLEAVLFGQATRNLRYSTRRIMPLMDIHTSGIVFRRNPTTFGTCKQGMSWIAIGEEGNVIRRSLRFDRIEGFSRVNLLVSIHNFQWNGDFYENHTSLFLFSLWCFQLQKTIKRLPFNSLVISFRQPVDKEEHKTFTSRKHLSQ